MTSSGKLTVLTIDDDSRMRAAMQRLLNGDELASRIRNIVPQLPIILQSGLMSH